MFHTKKKIRKNQKSEIENYVITPKKKIVNLPHKNKIYKNEDFQFKNLILMSKKKYNWRFVAPDTIPPCPPKVIIFKNKKNIYALGFTKLENKEYIGWVSLDGKNIGIFSFYYKNKMKKINGNYFILVDAKKDLEIKKKSLFSKKTFLSKINKYITSNDKKNIEKISKYKFEDLINGIRKVNNIDFSLITSENRWINHKLNKKGLHILRCLLAERIYEKKIFNKAKETYMDQDVLSFYKNGFLLKKFNNFKNSKLKNFLKKISNLKEKSLPKIKWKKISFKHIPNDNQYDMHIDSFHNTIKLWVYPGSLSKKHGPLQILPKSHINNVEKLSWLYKVSNSKVGLKEPSFRLQEKYFRKFGKIKNILPINKTKTILIANTHMFHRRGRANKNITRVTYRLEGDNDGGIKRINPFI